MLIPPAGLGASLLRLLRPEQRRVAQQAVGAVVPGAGTALALGEAILLGAEQGLRTIARGGVRLGEFLARQLGQEDTETLQQIDTALQQPLYPEEIPQGPVPDPDDNPLTFFRKVWDFARQQPKEAARWLAFNVGQSVPVTAGVVAGTALGGPAGLVLAAGTTVLSSAGEVGGKRIEAKDLPLILAHASIEYVSDLVVAAAGGLGLDDAAKGVVKRYVARLAQRYPTLSVESLTRHARRFIQTLSVTATPFTEAVEEGLQSGIESLSQGEGFRIDPASVVTGALVGGVLGPVAAGAGAAVRGVQGQATSGDSAALPEPAVPAESLFVQRPLGPAMEGVPGPVAAREIPWHLYVPENARIERDPVDPGTFVLHGRSVSARIRVQPTASNEPVETFAPRIREDGFEVAPGKIVRFEPLAELEHQLDVAELQNTPIEALQVEDRGDEVAPEYRPLINTPKKDIDVDDLSRLPLSEALKHPRLLKLYFDGAPPAVRRIADLADLARHVARLAIIGHEGRFWYERSALRLAKIFNLPVALPQGAQEALTPLEQEMADRLKTLGTPDRAAEARKFVALLAAYSPNTPPDENWMNAVTAYHQYLQQKRLNPNGPFKLDVGAAATPLAEKILNAPPGDEETLLGQKTRAFFRNLMAIIEGRGEDSVTVDLWVYRALGYPRSEREAPSPDQFAFAQRLVRDVAGALGWTPMQVQAALWVAERTLFGKQEQQAFDLYRRLQEGEISWRDFERERARMEKEALRLTEQGGAVFAGPGTVRSDDFGEVIDPRSLQFSIEVVRGWRNLLRPDTPYEIYEQFTREAIGIVENVLRDVGLDLVGAPQVLPGYWGGTDFNPSIQIRLFTPIRFAKYQQQFLNELLQSETMPPLDLKDGIKRMVPQYAQKAIKEAYALRRSGNIVEAAERAKQIIAELYPENSGRAAFMRYVASRAAERAKSKDVLTFLQEIALSGQPTLTYLRLLEGLVTSEESLDAATEAARLWREELWEQTKRWNRDPFNYPVDSGGVAEFWTRIMAVLPPEMMRRLETAAGILNMAFDQQAIGWHIIHLEADPGQTPSGLWVDAGRPLSREEIITINGILQRYLGPDYGWIGSRQEGLYIGLNGNPALYQALEEHFGEILAETRELLGDQIKVQSVLALSGLEFNPQLVETEEGTHVLSDSEAIASIAERWPELSAEESIARVSDLVARSRGESARILLERFGDYIAEDARPKVEAAAQLGGTRRVSGDVEILLRRPSPALDVAAGEDRETGGGGYRDAASGWQDLPVGARVHQFWRRLGYTVPGGGVAEILRRGKERLIDAFGLRTAVERRYFERLIDEFVNFIRIESDEKEYQILLSSLDEVFRPSGMELIGQRISSAHDLARLLAIYRNPHIEISRLLIIDRETGEVLHEMATTAWSPVYTWVALGGFQAVEEQLNHMGAKVRTWHGLINEVLDYYEQRTGRPVGVLFVHNHPSGNPNPSYNDILVSRYLAGELKDRFLASVVIDTGEMSVITVNPDTREETIHQIADPHAFPPLAKNLDLFKVIDTIDEQIRRRKDSVTFIVTRPALPRAEEDAADHGVVGIVSMHIGDFKRKVLKNPRRELQRIIKRFGGWNVIVFGPEEIADQVRSWQEKGWIALYADGKTLARMLYEGAHTFTRKIAPRRSTLIHPPEEALEKDEGVSLYVTDELIDDDDLEELSHRMTSEELANPATRPDVRQVIHQIDRVMRDIMDYPDPETFEEWDNEGLRLLRSPKERRRIERGEIYSPADVMAAKRLIDRIGADALRKAYRGDLSDLDQLINVVVGYRVARTEIARALAAGRDPVRGPAERFQEFAFQALTNPTKKELRQLRRLQRAEERQAILQQIRERTLKTLKDLQAKGIELDKVDWSNPLEAAHVIREIQAVRSEWSEKIYEYWINAILSLPSTHLVNTVSNLLMTLASLVIERPLQAMINDLFIKDPGLPTLGELPIIYKAVIKKALPVALYRARLAFKTELSILDDEVGGGTRFRTEVETVAIGGTVGRTVRIPKRLLLFSDEIFKNLAFYAQKASLLYRAGKAYGLQGQALERFVWEGMDEDTTGIDQAAYQFALKQVFQEDVPPIIKSVIRFRRDHLLFRYLFPFLVTPTNVFRRAVRYTWPGTIILAWRLGRGTIGKEEALERFVQNAIGWFTFWTIWLLTSDDDDDPRRTVITGSTSIARGARDLAYRAQPPASIKIANRWWSYSRLDPLATTLQIWVDTVRLIRAGLKDPEEAFRQAWQTATGVVTDKTFVATLDDLALLPLDPGGTVLRMAQRYSTSFVPALLRSVVRASDDVLRDTRPSREGVWWTKELFEKAFRGALAPWTLQPRVDLWGRPISTKTFEAPVTDFLFRLLTPVQGRLLDVHPADIVLLRWNQQHPREQYHPVLPDREFTYRGRTFWMPDDVYHKFLVVSGKLAATELASIFRKIPERPTRDHIEIIERVIERARREARRAILYEYKPELLEITPE
jgi:hypothetical protein